MEPASPQEQAEQAMNLALRHAFAELDPLCGDDKSMAKIFDDEDWAALAFEVTQFLPLATEAVSIHQPPSCKWHDHGPEMHLDQARARLEGPACRIVGRTHYPASGGVIDLGSGPCPICGKGAGCPACGHPAHADLCTWDVMYEAEPPYHLSCACDGTTGPRIIGGES